MNNLKRNLLLLHIIFQNTHKVFFITLKINTVKDYENRTFKNSTRP